MPGLLVRRDHHAATTTVRFPPGMSISAAAVATWFKRNEWPEGSALLPAAPTRMLHQRPASALTRGIAA